MIISQKNEIACLLLFVAKMAEWAVTGSLASSLKTSHRKVFQCFHRKVFQCFHHKVFQCFKRKLNGLPKLYKKPQKIERVFKFWGCSKLLRF